MKTVQMVNLWGETIDVPVPEQKDKGKRKPTVPKGYAGIPGSGPAGEMCQTCKHKHSTGNSMARVYWKCALMRNAWTGGPGTDIRMRSPACNKWEKQS